MLWPNTIVMNINQIILFNTHFKSLNKLIVGSYFRQSYIIFYLLIDGDLITIADATDFSHAREYSSTGVVKMVVFGMFGVILTLVKG